jgi:hypothetical protein
LNEHVWTSEKIKVLWIIYYYYQRQCGVNSGAFCSYKRSSKTSNHKMN